MKTNKFSFTISFSISFSISFIGQFSVRNFETTNEIKFVISAKTKRAVPKAT